MGLHPARNFTFAKDLGTSPNRERGVTVVHKKYVLSNFKCIEVAMMKRSTCLPKNNDEILDLCRNWFAQVMESATNNDLIHKYISTDEVIQIIHLAADFFSNEPTLLRMDLMECGKVIVVGGLYGNIDSLMHLIYGHGFPPDVVYVFLGNIVGSKFHCNERSSIKQCVTLLAVILMKICWPKNVIVLRGGQETILNGKHNGLEKECSLFPGTRKLNVFSEFQRMFNYLPLAAIISDKYLLVSGGVSQWMTCRQNISGLRKPIHLGNLKFIEAVMVADILFASPKDMEKLFEANTVEPIGFSYDKTVGYAFNSHLCAMVLDKLNVGTLIRGTDYEKGSSRDDFLNEMCFTIRTAPLDPNSCDEICCVLEVTPKFFEDVFSRPRQDVDIVEEENGSQIRRVIERHSPCEVQKEKMVLASWLQTHFSGQISRTVYGASGKRPDCRWCFERIPPYVKRKDCFVRHKDIQRWIHRYASDLLDSDPTYRNYFGTAEKATRALELFPPLYDVLTLAITKSPYGRTFRVKNSDSEINFEDTVGWNFGLYAGDWAQMRTVVPFSRFDESEFYARFGKGRKKLAKKMQKFKTHYLEEHSSCIPSDDEEEEDLLPQFSLPLPILS